ncbi:MAG: hypothetical protein KAU01_12705 [Candidatus Cloacimonetes bacterium]|nr:hypothetical protein [Candidatus Cloacimonadota bacterium]
MNKLVKLLLILTILIINYFLGIHHFILTIFDNFSLIKNLISWFEKFSPNLRAFALIITFEAAVVAILIPLSLEMISKISERYKSKVITNLFIKHRVIKFLPLLLITNIITAISLKFFVNKELLLPVFVKIIVLFIYILFIIIALNLLSFIKILKKYITQDDFIIKKFFEEIDDAIK